VLAEVFAGGDAIKVTGFLHPHNFQLANSRPSLTDPHSTPSSNSQLSRNIPKTRVIKDELENALVYSCAEGSVSLPTDLSDRSQVLIERARCQPLFRTPAPSSGRRRSRKHEGFNFCLEGGEDQAPRGWGSVGSDCLYFQRSCSTVRSHTQLVVYLSNFWNKGDGFKLNSPTTTTMLTRCKSGRSCERLPLVVSLQRKVKARSKKVTWLLAFQAGVNTPFLSQKSSDLSSK
jgi:hypothetical protein